MRVVSFNVGCHDLSHFVAEIATDEVLKDAEIIFLQETEEYHTTKEVKDTLQHFGYYNFFPSRSLKKGEHGIAIMSRVPITDYEVIELPSFNLRFRSRHRIAVKGTVEIDGSPVQICNIHLDSRLNIQDRIAQLTPLIEQMKKDNPKIILGGDFNTIPLRLYKNLLPIGKHDQVKEMNEFLQSHGLTTFYLQPKFSMKSRGIEWLLDFIYVRGLAIDDYGVRENIVKSDHHPVWADISN